MAKIKSASKRGVIAIVESPEPTATTMYIEGEGYKKDTLAPLFNAPMLMYSTGVPDDYYGANAYISSTTEHRRTDRLGQEGLTMALTRPTAYTTQHTNVTTGADTNPNTIQREGIVRFRHLLSMDPNRYSAPMVRFTNGADSVSVMHVTDASYNWYRLVYWKNFTNDFHEKHATYNISFDGSSDVVTTPYQYLANKGSYLSGISLTWRWNDYNSAYGGINASYMNLARCNLDGSGQNTGLTTRNWYNIQLVGTSELSGDPIYLYNYILNDHAQYITRHNVDAHTTTDLYSNTTAPLAADSFVTWTNAGGTRGTSIGNIPKWSSTVFDDPTSAGNKCWYTPYFDINYDFHPHFYQWDVSTDTFTRNTDITIVGDKSSSYILGMNGQPNTSYSSFAHRSAVWNDTFVSNGTRYLTVIPMTDSYRFADNIPASRTIVTYTVDASDPKILTHKNAVTVPYSIRQAVFLNDAKTILGVITYDAFYLYKWNDSTGWDLASTFTERMNAVGRDSLGRIWGLSSSYSNYPDIHLITTDTPVTITVVPENTSYDYTGTTISTYVNVSAYDYEGNRMELTATLEITGSSMQFTDGSSIKNVTTSTSGETQVAVNIIDGGTSDITASVAV